VQYISNTGTRVPTGEEAYLTLEGQSRRKRRPMREIAPASIRSDELKRSLQTE
jgi:hypothetical protein